MNRLVRTAAVHVALCAMILRALLPSGWMPQDAHSGSPIVICTADGALHVAGNPASGKQRTGEDAQHHDFCPFAAVPHLSTPASFASVVAPTAVLAFKLDFGPAIARRAQALYAPQSPRAPPQLG